MKGLDVHHAVYEWNYQRQLLVLNCRNKVIIRLLKKKSIFFGRLFALPRPLLQAIRQLNLHWVLLIDELDRSDEEFEAFLLELLSAFQISIPEMGTIKALHKPFVILTSNRTRELSDALKRRCFIIGLIIPIWKEMNIVRKRLPGIEDSLLRQVVEHVQAFRAKLSKTPGISGND